MHNDGRANDGQKDTHPEHEEVEHNKSGVDWLKPLVKELELELFTGDANDHTQLALLSSEVLAIRDKLRSIKFKLHFTASASSLPIQSFMVVGCSGVGKSTLMAAIGLWFRGDPRVVVLTEPVDAWRRVGALQGMYAGTVSALAFQLLALTTLTLPVLAALRSEGVRVLVVERSPRSNRGVFGALTLSEAELGKIGRAHV